MVKQESAVLNQSPILSHSFFQPTEQQIGCCEKCRRVGCPVFKSQLHQLYTGDGSKLLKLPKPRFLICKMEMVIPHHRTVGKIKGIMSVNELRSCLEFTSVNEPASLTPGSCFPPSSGGSQANPLEC